MPNAVPAPELRGYPKLANLMGPYPEIAIFRRFSSLTMLNLMSLQAELLEIEDKLQTCQKEDDASSDLEISTFSTSFCALNHSQSPKNRQRVLLESSRDKLEQYHKLLLRSAQVAQLCKPDKRSMKLLREWLIGQKEGNSFQSDLELLQTWDEAIDCDLITLTGRNSNESDFSKWFKPGVVDLYHWVWQQFRNTVDNESGRVYDYEDSKFMNISKLIFTMAATIIASLLPVLVILWLDNVKRTATRVWITIGFTASIGIVLKLFTNASMKEILAGTAAFAAVEVVFIGSANGT